MTEVTVATLTAEEARALTDDIRSRVTDLLPLITRAYEQRADRALGYPTWADYCAAELSGLRVPLGDRPAMVAELRQSGMSTRAIGSALGISHMTAQRDLESTGTSVTDDKVTSLDGRERPAVRPMPAPQMPARQDVADQILADIDQATAAEPDHTEGDARRDAELEELMAQTDVRFQLNFTSAAGAARQLLTFDIGRINDVFDDNWDRNVGDLLNSLDRWTAQVRENHRARQRAGLRVIAGGQQ